MNKDSENKTNSINSKTAERIVKKSEDISGWYNSVIEQAKLAEHGPVKGTMVWRPNGYAIWESIQKVLDEKIKALDVKNVYFPLFIPYSFLKKEKEHVKGFSPELAVVTHGGGEALEEPVVVRPTSETIMYSSFSNWIQSFRDLPLKINQWCNVVRWEKRVYYFLRTSEFLWQEGHTAHETFEDAQKMVEDALNAYIDFYNNHLALFGYSGRKSQKEKFAGADNTFGYEILMPDGKVVQACTSHNLGQNFAKAFDVKYQDRNGELQYVWQTSWGLSSRSIGAMILAHGDDNGLVLPPEVADIKAVIIPIMKKEADSGALLKFAKEVSSKLGELGVKNKIDDGDQSVGWKFNQYDLEGMPLRIEIGQNELSENKVKIVVRDNKETHTLSVEELEKTKNILKNMQERLFEKSKKSTLDNTRNAQDFEEFTKIMNTTRGFIKAFWCEDTECELEIKAKTKATTRCVPFDAKEENGKCVHCGKPAKYRWFFAQAY